MYQGIRMSGFGGQGVISAGILLAQAGLLEGKNVSWFPAYGAEMRGGTANCSVVVADDEVSSPIVSRPDTAVVLNEPSLAKFEPMLKPGGLLIVNSSLVNTKPKRTDIRVALVPCNAIAQELGTIKIANMVALGALAGLTGAVSIEAIAKALPKVFKRAKPEILELNVKALKKGAEAKAE
ncbi:MAG TPA: 2-oxoacid:ferredoxin oxidoreductase subunit gamma [candidate division Zixibacteria bacterium]|jgi:2-oxoglutarate ferredoxin oxidoreductase subunit gamma|nr:2-oxoacid:ferredoxin oxidoreductase subunit gamma [candidate division Zixibacteria bacterium]